MIVALHRRPSCLVVCQLDLLRGERGHDELLRQRGLAGAQRVMDLEVLLRDGMGSDDDGDPVLPSEALRSPVKFLPLVSCQLHVREAVQYLRLQRVPLAEFDRDHDLGADNAHALPVVRGDQ